MSERAPRVSGSEPYPVTPDARYFVIRGKLWRRANPLLSKSQALYLHKFMCQNTLKYVAIVMLYTDFLRELGKAGLSVRAFAELTGMNPNSISNYARAGELPTHLALIAVLIVGINEVGGDYRRVMSKIELTPKKPRGGARQGHFGGDRQTNLNLER